MARLKSGPSRSLRAREFFPTARTRRGRGRRDEHGAAVAVVAGVVDVLQAGGEVDAAPDVDGVIGLQDIFAAVVQGAVAEKEPKTAIGEVGSGDLS